MVRGPTRRFAARQEGLVGFAVGMRAGTGPGAGAGRRPASGVPPFQRQSPGRRVRPGGLEGERTCTRLSPRGLHLILRFRRGVSPLPHVTRCPEAYSVSGSTPCLFCHSGGGAVTGQPGVGEGNLGSEEGPFLEPSDLFCLSIHYAYGSTRSDQAPLARRLSGARGGHWLRSHCDTVSFICAVRDVAAIRCLPRPRTWRLFSRAATPSPASFVLTSSRPFITPSLPFPWPSRRGRRRTSVFGLPQFTGSTVSALYVY